MILPMAGVADVTVLAGLHGIDATRLAHLEAVRAVGHGTMTARPSSVPSRIWRSALGHTLRPPQPPDLRPVLHAQHLPMLQEVVRVQPKPRGQFQAEPTHAVVLRLNPLVFPKRSPHELAKLA
ncbi:hypothetical protein [Micromonospora chersina]|uniref:hypothetical protein n=1 Tax=Micromonospora chersina TaxID=47854 RepID=UPI0033C22268